ncbi:MAG: nuclear transport factor 2 family protein [Verrucomicrobia bacterium]|nr:nuclear transport factor 2 family protein [Verrucomicrobiota bacterium]
MQRIHRTYRLLAALLLFFVAAIPLRAQEWSAAQKEVWKSVEAYWALDAARDIEGFLGYFHDDYLGWSVEEALPTNKATVRKFVEHFLKTTKVLVQNIQPAGIKLHGDVAIVHYYWTRIYRDSEGKEKNESGRWTDILKKQGDRWVLIGDHGGRTSKDAKD